jgi:hypothetical protein
MPNSSRLATMYGPSTPFLPMGFPSNVNVIVLIPADKCPDPEAKPSRRPPPSSNSAVHV